LASLPQHRDPNLLVGFENNDDAGVYRINAEQALVMTADFITPPVDDPHVFGQIAAANALGDIYAMGGRPVACINLMAFPSKKLPEEQLHGIAAGALDKITEAGAVLVGGHTIEDDEPKFGLAVTGLVHPDRYWANSGARPGDALVLTKPLGSGVLFNANLKGWVSADAMSACIEILSTLNRKAAETAQRFDVHAATDVTGFGLSGHGLEMARGSGVTMAFDLEALPVMDEALAVYRRGMSTGVNGANRAVVAGHIRFDTTRPDWHREIVFDPQTSGGLLLAVPGEQGDALVAALHDAGIGAAQRVGEVLDPKGATHLIFR
jgi:selenide,water dikinase